MGNRFAMAALAIPLFTGCGEKPNTDTPTPTIENHICTAELTVNPAMPCAELTANGQCALVDELERTDPNLYVALKGTEDKLLKVTDHIVEPPPKTPRSSSRFLYCSDETEHGIKQQETLVFARRNLEQKLMDAMTTDDSRKKTVIRAARLVQKEEARLERGSDNNDCETIDTKNPCSDFPDEDCTLTRQLKKADADDGYRVLRDCTADFLSLPSTPDPYSRSYCTQDKFDAMVTRFMEMSLQRNNGDLEGSIYYYTLDLIEAQNKNK